MKNRFWSIKCLKARFTISGALPHIYRKVPVVINKWQATLTQVAYRFNRYRGEAFELPAEVEAMPIFRGGLRTLTAKIASPFWKSLNPKRTSAVWILAVASA